MFRRARFPLRKKDGMQRARTNEAIFSSGYSVRSKRNGFKIAEREDKAKTKKCANEDRVDLKTNSTDWFATENIGFKINHTIQK